jgi:hypothetical protein
MWLLNIAMDANPIGLIILLLTGVVAAIGFAATNMDRYGRYFVGVWDMMRGGVLSSVENIYNGVAGMVNGIVDGINHVIDVINLLGASIGRIDFKMAALDLGGAATTLQGARAVSSTMLFGGTPMGTGNGSAPGGPRPMAAGGIVTQPLNALVGEAGPEAIIPLDRLGNMGGSTYNITVQAGVGDPASIGQTVVEYIKRFERSSGPVFRAA